SPRIRRSSASMYTVMSGSSGMETVTRLTRRSREPARPRNFARCRLNWARALTLLSPAPTSAIVQPTPAPEHGPMLLFAAFAGFLLQSPINPPATGARQPAYAHDGRLAISAPGDLWIESTGGKWTRLTSGPAWDREPAW